MPRAESSRSEREGPIAHFRGEWFFLSNFSPANVTFEGLTFPTVEHAYQAARCARASDRHVVRSARTPGEAKRLGRAFDQVDNWMGIRESVMVELLRQKFAIPALRQLLLETGDRPLVEENDWGDTFWGQVDGVGQNRLGHILEVVRSELRSALPNDGSSCDSSPHRRC